MARLIHLNGVPGIGKSTVARRYAAEHPGVLCCDIDVLRTLIGGWEDDFGGAGSLIRPPALAMISAYLSGGHDVVLPQLIARPTELKRFEAAATDVGATFLHLVLIDVRDASIARFHRRGGDPDPWHDQVRRILAEEGGDEVLALYHAALSDLVARRPDTVVVRSVEGDVEATYAAVLAAVR